MGGIGTTISVYDNVTKPMTSIIKSLHAGVNAFKQVKAQTNTAFNPASITSTNAALKKTQSINKGINAGLKQTTSTQKQMNKSLSEGSKVAGDLQKKLKQVIVAYASYRTVLKGLTLSDSLVTNNMRIASINNGAQTDTALRNSIYSAASSAGANYLDFSRDVTSFGLSGGRNFSGPEEVTKFVELLYKQAQTQGAAESEISSIMSSISEAIDTGKLESGGVKNIIMYAPQLAEEIARVSGTTVEGLKELAGQGGITADVLKKSLFSIEGTINEQYSKVPRKFGDMWTIIKNEAIHGYEDASQYLSELVNVEAFKKSAVYIGTLVGDITKIIGKAVGRITGYVNTLSQNQNVVKMFEDIRKGALITFDVLLYSLDLVAAAVTVVADNWIWLRYVIIGAVGVFVALKIAAIAAAIGVNAALWPITLTVGAIVVGIYLLVSAFNKLTGESVSASGIIAGALSAAFALIQNGIALAYNSIIVFAEFFTNVFNNPVYSVQRLFANLLTYWIDLAITGSDIWGSFVNGFANMFIGGINKIKSAWNGLASSSLGQFLGLNSVELTPSVDIASGMVGNLESMKSGISAYMDAQMPDDYKVYDKMGYTDVNAAGDAGYNWGAGAESSIKGIWAGNSLGLADSGITTTGNVNYGGANTGLSGKSGTIAELRDFARRENVGSSGTKVVSIEMNNEFHIDNGMSEEEVFTLFTDAVEEALDADAEGV